MKLLKKGESEILEFKESFDRECMETAVAFANTKGGIIIVGVSDGGGIKGVSVGKESLTSWANEISEATEPRVIPEVEERKVGGKKIVLISIREFPFKPVAVRGRCFRRVGKSNRVMTPAEVAEMYLQSLGTSWDALPASDANMEDLDPEKVKKYVRRANASGRRRIENGDLIRLLENLELIRDGKPTWAAVLLFGKRPPTPRILSPVHCGRFRKDKTQIIDDLFVEDDLIEQVDGVMKFIARHISVRYEFEGKPERREVWEYPLEALREAVINAIVHRDYTFPSHVSVEIYDDCIRIWSPGKLPLGVTLEDLRRKPHDSVPRNKLIARIFYDIKYIENVGRGTTDMMEKCEANGLPPPEFEETTGGFCVIFRKDVYTEEYLRGLGLNERQIRAVMYVKERGRITNREYQKVNQVSRQTAARELLALVESELLIRCGKTGRATHYTLAKTPQISGTPQKRLKRPINASETTRTGEA